MACWRHCKRSVGYACSLLPVLATGFMVTVDAEVCGASPGLRPKLRAGLCRQTAAPAKQRAPVVTGLLSDLVAQTPWDAAKRGPLLVIDPANVRLFYGTPLPPVNPAGSFYNESIGAFKRMVVRVGTLTAIVPTEMTVIHDTPGQAPNLYDGLPPALKMKYLLATLTPEQWKKLGTDGLGVSDLSAEQRPVMLSILPDPFKYGRWQYDEKGEITEESGNNIEQILTLPPDERVKVKLRVQQQADVSIAFANPSNGFLPTNSDSGWRGKPHAERLSVRGDDRTDRVQLFGVTLSSNVPNKLKPSALNYDSARLSGPIALDGVATVGDLISRIAESARLELYADPRIASLPVVIRGTQARAGDILKALALGVTGTFRRLDTAYVFTHDTVGIGTQQLRLAEWQSEINLEVKRREKEIMRLLRLHSGRGRGIYTVGFAPDDPYALTPDLSKEAEAGHPVTGDKLSPEMVKRVHEYAEIAMKNNPMQPLNEDLVQLTVKWTYAYQMGDGRPFQGAGYLGEYADFDADKAAKEEAAEAEAERRRMAALKPAADLHVALPLPLPAWAEKRTVFLTPNGPDQAIAAVRAARQLGFTALALRTDDPAVLKAAIHEAGQKQLNQINQKPVDQSAAQQLTGAQQPQTARAGDQAAPQIYAVVAPFAVSSPADGGREALDINLVGESEAEIVAARSRLPRWQSHVEQVVTSASPHPIPERIIGTPSALAPLSPELKARLRYLAELAGTEGLAGIYWCDTQPGGYAGKRPAPWEANEWGSNIPRDDFALPERENLGYTLPMRLAFLRKTSVDPIDLIPPGLYLDADLPRPFFPDPEAVTHYSINISDEMRRWFPQVKAQWDEFRGETNRKALADLYAAVRAVRPDLPLYVEARPELNNDAHAVRYWSAWTAWTQPEPLPVANKQLFPDRDGEPTAGEGVLWPHQFSASALLPARALFITELVRLQEGRAQTESNGQIAFDLSYLPGDRALALLKECVAPHSMH